MIKGGHPQYQHHCGRGHNLKKGRSLPPRYRRIEFVIPNQVIDGFPKLHKYCGGIVHAFFDDESCEKRSLKYYCEKCGETEFSDDEFGNIPERFK